MALLKSQQDIINERTKHYEYRPYPRWLHLPDGDKLVQDELEEKEALGGHGFDTDTQEPDTEINRLIESVKKNPPIKAKPADAKVVPMTKPKLGDKLDAPKSTDAKPVA